MDRVVKEWHAEGYCFFEETVWSSSVQQNDLKRVCDFLSNNDINNVDVSIVSPPDDSTKKIDWIKYFRADGQCVSTNIEVSIPARSNNLKLTFCYKNSEEHIRHQKDKDHVVNALRLIFGVPIAHKMVFRRFFEVGESETRFFSETGFASFFDTQNLNFFDSPPIEKAEVICIPEEASNRLNKAFSQTFPEERFIFLWLAFEAIINSFDYQGSNGEKRRKFFTDELGSEVLNAEVFRLFKVRCEVFKEGRFSKGSIEDECIKLYSIIQISILKDCPQRKAFIEGFEGSLSIQN